MLGYASPGFTTLGSVEQGRLRLSATADLCRNFPVPIESPRRQLGFEPAVLQFGRRCLHPLELLFY
jgi:hypothetical protein